MHHLFVFLVPNSIRNRASAQLNNNVRMYNPNASSASFKRDRNRGMLQGIRDGNSFTRLVNAEYEMSSNAYQAVGKPGAKTNMEELGGRGIVVTTEITVTQEERIANVIGI